MTGLSRGTLTSWVFGGARQIRVRPPPPVIPLSPEIPTWPLLALAGVLVLGCASEIAPALPAPTAPPIALSTPTQGPQSASAQTRSVPPLTHTPTSSAVPILEATPGTTSVSLLQATPDTIHLSATPIAAGVERPAPSLTATPGPPHPTVTIGDAVFRAELVSTPETRARGLSGREGLPAGTGMLFIFETGVAPPFWMKEMRFPLDLVWIGKDCTVVDITLRAPIPAPDTPLSELPNYASQEQAGYTFEIDAGEAERHGITAGARVRFSGLPAGIPATCE